MSLRTTMLTSALAVVAIVAACSDDPHKKMPDFSPDAGSAGEAGQVEHELGGSGGSKLSDAAAGQAGEAGAIPTPAQGGANAEAGASGAGEAAAGEAGANALPTLHVLFTVARGAKGLPGSAVSAEANPSNVIFGSPSVAGLDALAAGIGSGTNRVAISAAQLGLSADDTIDAIAIIQRAPQAPTFLFSVASPGQHGVQPTRLYRSSRSDGAPGDVYFSDGVQSSRWLAEDGDQLGSPVGYNGLLLDQLNIGLGPMTAHGNFDDLSGVLFLPSGTLPTRIYFSVDSNSSGLPNSSLAGTNVNERGCTIYESSLDGRNSIAYRCAELGLEANADTQSDIKGLALLDGGAARRVLFTVHADSKGNGETALDAAAYAANNVYESSGDGSNSLRVSGPELGLDHSDALDALGVLDRAPQNYGIASSCLLAPAPDASGGAELQAFNAAHGLGKGLLLVTGSAQLLGDQRPTDRVAAYDLKSCVFVSRADILPGALPGRHWVAVPFADWLADDPLNRLEYWRFPSTEDHHVVIQRLDAAGAVLNTYAFDDVPDDTFEGDRLDYDPVHQLLVGTLRPLSGGGYQRISFAYPASSVANNAALHVLRTPLPHPCADAPSFTGLDARGNSYFAQWDQPSNANFRVCPLGPSGEFVDLPFSVSLGEQTSNYGVIVPGDSLYALLPSNGWKLQRQALSPNVP